MELGTKLMVQEEVSAGRRGKGRAQPTDSKRSGKEPEGEARGSSPGRREGSRRGLWRKGKELGLGSDLAVRGRGPV